VEFHPKIAIFVGCGAFLLSIVLGLVNGAPFFLCLAKGVFFAIVFFVITAAIYNIIKGNLMEAPYDPEAPKTGENIDITLGGNVPDFDAKNGADDIDNIVFDENGNLNLSKQSAASAPGAASETTKGKNGAAKTNTVQGGPDPEAETAAPKDRPKGGLEQNVNSGYNNKSSSVSSAGSASDTDDDDLSFDGADFIAGMPGLNDNPEDKAFKKSQSSVKESIEGDFEMTVSKRPEKNIDLSDLGPDVSSKKVADAIHTLLVKEKEG